MRVNQVLIVVTASIGLAAIPTSIPSAQFTSGPPYTQVSQPVRSEIPTAFVPLSDPGFVYSEFVNATLDSTGVQFDRTVVPWIGALHSPGTRISFRTDAKEIEMRVSYVDVEATPGAGIFRLEVDGVLLPGLFGSDTDLGIKDYPLIANSKPETHEYSLIWPYAGDVKLVGMQLTGGTARLQGTPTPRPSFLYAAYGDSITHGFDGSSAAHGYPFRVGKLRNWSVTNMGFRARRVSPPDGTALAALGADCLSVAIGLNDYFGPTPTTLFDYGKRYDEFIGNIRNLQPTVPLFVITPTWVGFEGVPNSLGLTVNDYRQVIFDVAFRRQGTDPNLYIVLGPSLVPGNLTNFPGGIHPSDAGLGLYASSLDSVFSGVFGSPDAAVNPFLSKVFAEGLQHSQLGLISGVDSKRILAQSDLLQLRPPHSSSLLRNSKTRESTGPGVLRIYSGGQRGDYGLPRLRLSGPHDQNDEPLLFVANDSGQPMLGRIFVSNNPQPLRRFLDGIQSDLNGSSIFMIPNGGLRIPFAGYESLVDGDELWMMLVQPDSSLPSGVASSRICSFRFGDRYAHTRD